MKERHIEAIPERWVTYTYHTGEDSEVHVVGSPSPNQRYEPPHFLAEHPEKRKRTTHPINISFIHPKQPPKGLAPEGHIEIELQFTEQEAEYLRIRLTRLLQMWRGELTPDDAIAAIHEDDDEAETARKARNAEEVVI